MRQIVLDTETTGLEPSEGHRIIEIGCIEMINRRVTGNNYHQYIQPDRKVDEGALEVHGISDEFLADKPRMAEVMPGFLEYARGAELIIHNAPFDVGFLNHEMALLDASLGKLQDLCMITDTLAMARQERPGQRNSLDALCRVYGIDNTHRELHGALLDSQILADVYLAMTGGQGNLFGGDMDDNGSKKGAVVYRKIESGVPLSVIRCNAEEQALHEEMLQVIEKNCGEAPIWQRFTVENESPPESS